jgi:N-acylneuraminate cytidylyltransferase/CMP-N,N'-diacetyllegionaminic acid synthase
MMPVVGERILGIIPARSGSVRVVNKNVRRLGGRPLIEWTIRAARESGALTRIIVSTDSEEIAVIARRGGAEAPWLRSPAFATDTAPVIDAVLEALDRIEAAGETLPDGIMLLQPTSPFRTAESIRAACSLFVAGQGCSVVSVRPVRDHPAWCRRIDEQGCLVPLNAAGGAAARSQDVEPVFALNGAVYLATPHTLRQERSFHSARTTALVMRSQIESLDIDTPEDWLIAEACVSLPKRQEDVLP